MRKITIKRLVLENFKCHRYLQLDLDGRNVALFGDNATGKTSVYDALTWLLFGKDSAGNGEKNIEIKPLDAMGNVLDHSAITSVEAELEADGQTMTFKRTYQEVWSTKRGSSRETFDGNTSEYFVDGVPCKKYAFEKKIQELVPEDVFRLLTAVDYFADTMHWQKRRAVLFDMAGTLTDREIMATDARFLPLSQAVGNLSLEDYRRKLAAEKKGFVGIKSETPARLSECQKTAKDLEGLDFAAARAEAAALEEQRREISAQLLALDHNSAADTKRMEIREVRLELDKLKAENQTFRAMQTVGKADISALEHQLVGEQTRLATNRTLLDGTRRSLGDYNSRIQSAREQWITVNGEAFTGGTCPTCGQSLPIHQLKAATESFDAQKRKRLQQIEETAEALKQSKADAEARIQSLEAEISERESRVQELGSQILTARNSAVTVVDMEGYAPRHGELLDRLRKLESDMEAMAGDTYQVKAGLRSQLEMLDVKIRAAQSVAAKESVLQYSRKREEEIRQDASNAAAALEAIEQMLFLAEEYIRHKARFVEDSVNSLFQTAKFRLFREQANGGLEERCDVVYDGVPYIGLNNGMKINVGIDIINALSLHYGVTVPLFVDNAEGVTRLAQSGAQVIRLVVSESDKELKCVYEN